MAAHSPAPSAHKKWDWEQTEYQAGSPVILIIVDRETQAIVFDLNGLVEFQTAIACRRRILGTRDPAIEVITTFRDAGRHGFE